ncbi:membrane dipeptidase [Romboutsia maritimum]|uniref:Membrane dipeptidase n=1 Tax=Romboutsia maritimum TaxID=2020948 RepID=A0A371IW00_9FIRM|nr:membrane dipeptidase [Romboutsia maritimum]RDY24649.1 membrane dipeptidase [Romboutsia maritimum]
MILDIHADIFTDIFNKKMQKDNDIIRKYHLDKLKKGKINGGLFVIWQNPYGKYCDYNSLKLMMDYGKEELEISKDILSVVKTYKEYIKSLDDGKITAMMHIEGIKSLEDDLSKIDEIYEYGIRFASLTWNEENKFANGCKSHSKEGLKLRGKEFIKIAQDMGIIIDVSHASDETMYDIYNVSQKPIIATHSNCRKLCNVKRNLLDNQIKLIKETGGIIGVNAYRDFIDSKKENQDVNHLVNHIDHLVDLIGIDSVCFGFDYCDYMEDELKDNIYEREEVTRGLEDASKTQNIITELKNRGYKDGDIKKLSNENFLKFIKLNISK